MPLPEEGPNWGDLQSSRPSGFHPSEPPFSSARWDQSVHGPRSWATDLHRDAWTPTLTCRQRSTTSAPGSLQPPLPTSPAHPLGPVALGRGCLRRAALSWFWCASALPSPFRTFCFLKAQIIRTWKDLSKGLTQPLLPPGETGRGGGGLVLSRYLLTASRLSSLQRQRWMSPGRGQPPLHTLIFCVSRHPALDWDPHRQVQEGMARASGHTG